MWKCHHCGWTGSLWHFTCNQCEWQVWQTSLHNPSFSAYANLCGGFGVKVTNADRLEEAINAALGHNGPALVEVISDADLI